jgi:hypothetical protein
MALITNIRPPTRDTSTRFSLLSRLNPAAPTKPSSNKPPFAPSPIIKYYNYSTAGHISRECPCLKRTPSTITDIKKDQITKFKAGEYSNKES